MRIGLCLPVPLDRLVCRYTRNKEHNFIAYMSNIVMRLNVMFTLNYYNYTYYILYMVINKL